MTRVAILGATGYTALELIKILLRHPDFEVAAVTSPMQMAEDSCERSEQQVGERARP